MTQAVLNDGSTASAAAAVDPVCGMTVDPAKAAGRAEHGGRTFLFCSGHCLNEFQRDPVRYVGARAGTSEATPANTTSAVDTDMHAAGVTPCGARCPPTPPQRPRQRSARPR